ncbi:MAG: hypothetical protein KUG55_07045 [Cycloclasticus sp.]|jgi:2,4-dienoyl-CoA reductase-like NADH-dependent reductase (Old Yellow Enzyme family)|nr:hypothetical protein [Cycloclasticus sp.]
MAQLFDPFQIRGITPKNRVCVSPMSQYRAKDGVANHWPGFSSRFCQRKTPTLHQWRLVMWDARVANTVIESGQADLIAIGKELLNNPNWTLQAAKKIAADGNYSLWDPAFGWWLSKRERVMRKLGL